VSIFCNTNCRNILDMHLDIKVNECKRHSKRSAGPWRISPETYKRRATNILISAIALGSHCHLVDHLKATAPFPLIDF